MLVNSHLSSHQLCPSHLSTHQLCPLLTSQLSSRNTIPILFRLSKLYLHASTLIFDHIISGYSRNRTPILFRLEGRLKGRKMIMLAVMANLMEKYMDTLTRAVALMIRQSPFPIRMRQSILRGLPPTPTAASASASM